jgi:hypothetical protein
MNSSQIQFKVVTAHTSSQIGPSPSNVHIKLAKPYMNCFDSNKRVNTAATLHTTRPKLTNQLKLSFSEKRPQSPIESEIGLTEGMESLAQQTQKANSQVFYQGGGTFFKKRP